MDMVMVRLCEFSCGCESTKRVDVEESYFNKNYTVNEFGYEFLFYENKLWIKEPSLFNDEYSVVSTKSQVEEAFHPEYNKVMSWFKKSYDHYMK